MLDKAARFCDVCGEEIPKGTIYRLTNLQPEGAAMLLEVRDKDLVPTWTQNPDGTVNLDICKTCHLSLAHLPVTMKIN